MNRGEVDVVKITPPVLVNEFACLETLLIISLIYLFFITSAFSVWLIGAAILFSLGFLGLGLQLNIYIGFLWVIDLGVGLIFLVFLSSLMPFMESSFNAPAGRERRLSSAFLLGMLFAITSYCVSPIPFPHHQHSTSTIQWLNYYVLLLDQEISQLNLLRELFFYTHVWEFVLINYIVLIGLIGMLIFNFTIHQIFKTMNLTALLFDNAVTSSYAPLFIRDQNLLRQQQTTSSVRLWVRKQNTM